jgi:hypothetical protein
MITAANRLLTRKPFGSSPVAISSHSGRAGAGSLVLPAVSGTDVLILMERDGTTLRSGFTNIIYNTSVRTYRLSYIQSYAGATITTTGDTFYLILSNFGSVGQTANTESSSSGDPYPVPGLTGLDTSGSALVFAFRYNNAGTDDVWTSTSGAYSLYSLPSNRFMGLIEENTAASITGATLTVGSATAAQYVMAACEILAA